VRDALQTIHAKPGRDFSREEMKVAANGH